MGVASDLFGTVELKRELSFGVKDTDTDDAELLRRVEFNPKYDQPMTESNEIMRSMQTENYSRGIKSVTSSLKTDAKAGAYKSIWEALVRQDFNTGVVSDITATDIAAVAMVNNLTTSGDDWTVSAELDLEVGDEIKFSGFTGGNKANNNKRWICLASAAGTMKLRPKTDNIVMLADAAGENITIWNLGTADNPKTNKRKYTTVAAVADTAIFTTAAGDFTAPFNAGNIVKADGFTGANIGNNDRPFKITKITATQLFGYYTDNSLPVGDAAGESVTITKSDLVKLTYNATNLLAVATATRLTSSSSFIAEGFKIHDVVRLGNMPTSTNNARNLLITSFNAAGTQMNFAVIDDDATTVPMVVESGVGNEVVTLTFVGSSAGVETVIIDGVTYTTGGVETATVIATGVAALTFPGYTVTNPSAGVVKFTKNANGAVSDTALVATGTYISEGGVATLAIVSQGTGAVSFVTRVGSKAFIPQINHTNRSFMIEKWQSDITQSEQYTGLRVNMAKLTMPNSGIPSVDFDFIGKDIETAQAHYYTSSNEPQQSENVDSIFGRVYVAGISAGCVTSFEITVSANLSALDKCVGEDTTHDIVAGVYKINGSMTVYFEDEVMRDHFLNKDELSMVFILKESNAYNADFLAFQMPRLVYSSTSNSGGIKHLLTIPFSAYQNPTGDDGTEASKLMSSFSIQDSIA